MNTVKKGRRKMTVWIIIIFITILIWNFLPPSPGKMPLFYNNNGSIIPDSLSEKIYININGAEIGLLITGRDKTNPVLLFLGGGPGIPEYLLEYLYPVSYTHLDVYKRQDRGSGVHFC